MASMANQMKKKAIPASSVKRSTEIVKVISRADVVELNRSMEPKITQNRKEYIEMAEAINRDTSIYRDNSQGHVLKKVKR